MTHRILECGAIACSAVIATQWLPSFAVQLPTAGCQKKFDSESVHSPLDSAPETQFCLDEILALIEGLPERFRLQWSQGRTSQLPRSLEREYQQLIEQAQTLVTQNRVAEAIVVVSAIPQNSRSFDLAHQLQETWSQDVLQQAGSHYQQAELTAALNLLKAIPTISSHYHQATQLKRQWQQQAVQLYQAIAASKAGNWQGSLQRLERLKGTPLFHTLPVQELWQIATINMLEPDANLLHLASIMDSTAFPEASLPSSPRSASVVFPLAVSPAPSPSRLETIADRALQFSGQVLLVSKLTKPDRQPAMPPPESFKLEASPTSTLDKRPQDKRRTIAKPDSSGKNNSVI